MFPNLTNDNLKVIKTHGEIIENVKGSVQKNSSNGGIETFEVLNPNFYEQHGGISAHYQMEVINIKDKKDMKTGTNTTINIENINNGNNQFGNSNNMSINISSTEFIDLIQKLNNKSNEEKESIFSKLKQIANTGKTVSEILINLKELLIG